MAEGGSKGRDIAVWVGCVALAALYAYAGGTKVFGTGAAEGAIHFGLNENLMTFIGVCEMAAAVGLLVPRLTSWAALGLIPVMVGAIFNHLAVDPIAQAAPAVVTLALVCVVGWYRKDEALFLAPSTSTA